MVDFSEAKRKARYGRRDWLVWQGRQGEQQVSPCTAEAVKAAMLSVGTHGRFIRLAAGSGIPQRIGWRLGVVMLRNCRRGFDGPAVSI